MGAESVKPCFWIIESSLSSISWEKRLELFLADTLRQCDAWTPKRLRIFPSPTLSVAMRTMSSVNSTDRHILASMRTSNKLHCCGTDMAFAIQLPNNDGLRGGELAVRNRTNVG